MLLDRKQRAGLVVGGKLTAELKAIVDDPAQADKPLVLEAIFESDLGTSNRDERIALRTAIKLVPFYIAALALLFPQVWDPQRTLERSRLLTLLGSNLWLGIYLAAAAMTRRRQSLHDLATGTAVRDA